MPVYNLSTFGKPIVIKEDSEELPQIRIFMLILEVIVYLTVTYFEIKLFSSVKLKTTKLKCLFWLYVINNTLYVGHCVDNIARPVDYFEPKYLYQEYLLSTMEITFYISMVTIIGGHFPVTKLLDLGSRVQLDHVAIRQQCKYLIFYCLSTALCLLHYRIEPIWSYSTAVNTVLISAGVSTATLLILVLIVRRDHNQMEKEGSVKYRRLGTINDIEESNEQTDKSIGSSKVRRRSKTPVGESRH